MPRVSDAAARPVRRAGLSVRIKLALSYAVFIVLVGVVLFTVGFLLLRFVPDANLYSDTGGVAPGRRYLLAAFSRYSWWALAFLTVVGIGGGWLLAGQMLKPLTRITDVARKVRGGTLGLRIDLPGSRNEITELADAFDSMLERVNHTVDEQRRFAANASHELRTPHAIVRTMLEVARADPSTADPRRLFDRIYETNERAIALTEALLELSRVEHQAPARTHLDLAAVVAEVMGEVRADAAASGIRIEASLVPAPILANPTLIAQLVSNLARNALGYNAAHDGWIRVETHHSPRSGARFTMENTGEVVDAESVATLVEPFVRGAGRVRSPDGRSKGAGLGLALVASIVRVHEGTFTVEARPGGGLLVTVALPNGDGPAQSGPASQA